MMCPPRLDYSCLNQDSSPLSQLTQLDAIMTFSDCLFTPLLGSVPPELLSYTAQYSDTPLPAWNTPGSGFLQRAWCRTELLYACNIPTFPDTATRLHVLKQSLHHFATIGRRPHYVYSTQQDEESGRPMLAPLLQNSLLHQLTPEYGQSSFSEDRVAIMQLVSRLRPHVERSAEGYFGDRRGYQMHGRGLLRFASGAMYQGDFCQGKKQGKGTFVYATGNVYTGDWSV